MAKDTTDKKRKASVPEIDAEKVKKVKKAAPKSEAPAQKRKATEDASPAKVKKSKTPADVKGAENVDTSNEDAEMIATTPVVPKKASAAEKKTNGATKGKKVNRDSAEPKTTKKEKTTKKADTKKSKPEPVEPAKDDDENDEVAVGEEEDSDDSEIDDQTLALLRGFESDGDEDDAVNGEGFTPGQEVPKLDAKAIGLTPKEQKKLKKLAQAGESEKPGVVYVGRIPHGFYENEMKAYFKQFGTILKIRLSRNKKTGQSKHFAWIQFESATVADIVARTMDNYLMFGHILKVKLIPDEQVHEDLFKGANKRFKKVPWNKIQGRKLEQAVSEKQWDKRVGREVERRDKKADKLKAIGYEFEAPKVKTTKEITKKEKTPLALTAEEKVEEPKVIEAALSTEKPRKLNKVKKSNVSKDVVLAAGLASVVEETNKPKKEKKAKAIKDAVPEVEPAPLVEEPEKTKKEKKSREVVVEAELAPVVEETKKPKKEKKAKAIKDAVPEVEPAPLIEEPSKTKKEKKFKEVVVEAELAPVVEETNKPKKEKKGNAAKAVGTVAAETTTDVQENTLNKKSKSNVVEDVSVAAEPAEKKAKKQKKDKKLAA